MSKEISVTHLVDLILQANNQQNPTNKKAAQKEVFEFGLCLSQGNQHAAALFLSLCPPCPPPSISKIFWELAFIAQSTNVENHKDALIGKINYSQAAWAISIQTTKQFSVFREDGLVEKIVITPQND